MKNTRIIKFTLAMLILLIAQSFNLFAQSPPTTQAKCLSGNCSNGYGKFIYDDGDIYEGDFVNGKREGQGTYTSKSGKVHIGRFANNQPNGKGKLKYPDGENYEGDFVNGKFEGQGTYNFKNGEVYVGQFANGTSNGKGKETYLNGDSSSSCWVSSRS